MDNVGTYTKSELELVVLAYRAAMQAVVITLGESEGPPIDKARRIIQMASFYDETKGKLKTNERPN